ncbi:MAG TPA: amidohydrolase family protein [Mycobacteriales bacterium]|nr:amidohydrolase family protein [Mycobacteriales bacterium]
MSTTVFRNAVVLPCTGADPIEGGSVVVENGVIVDIGSGPASGTEYTVDCRGGTLMPGLIDAHVHVCSLDVEIARQQREYTTSLLAYATAKVIKDTLLQGYTTVRDAGGADWGMKEAIRRGLIPGPHLLVSGHPLSQTGGHGDARTRAQGCGCGAAIGMIDNIADGVDEVRKAAREQLRQGVDAVKVMAGGGVASPTDPLESPQYQPDELRAIVAEASAAGTYVLAHAYTPASIANAVEAGVRSIEHGNLLDEPTAALMARSGAYLVPTLVTYEKLYEEGREYGLGAEKLAKLETVLGAGLEGLRRAVDAGVAIGSGSDLLGPLARHRSRELAIKAQVLGAHDTLIATTRTNAELLQIADVTGTIEVGKRADLLVVGGDPLADIAILQDIEALAVIMKSGAFVVNRL